MALNPNTQEEIIEAYKVGKINQPEAIRQLQLLNPSLIEPILEILLRAVKRQNVVDLKNRKV